MIVTYIADRHLYHLLPTAINSLLRNNPRIHKVYLFLEDDEVSFLRHPKVKIFNLNNYNIPRIRLNCTSRYPYTAMARLFLDSILEENKIIYLDVDTIVDGRLRELWNIDLTDCYVAAREEAFGYYNSGVLLMNLQLMREHHTAKSLQQVLESRPLDYPDQAAMNQVFNGHIKNLPKRFNVFERFDIAYQEEIVVRHFVGIHKPWLSSANSKDTRFWKQYYCNSLEEFN